MPRRESACAQDALHGFIPQASCAQDPARRVGTVSFRIEGRDAREIPARLDAERLATRWGHFHSHRAVEALGLHPSGGVVRVSLVHYTAEEMSRLIAALDRAI
jgi:selenocysteine lyase/cysteine desulfurase